MKIYISNLDEVADTEFAFVLYAMLNEAGHDVDVPNSHSVNPFELRPLPPLPAVNPFDLPLELPPLPPLPPVNPFDLPPLPPLPAVNPFELPRFEIPRPPPLSQEEKNLQEAERQQRFESIIRTADVVIGVASPNLFNESGSSLRRLWNTILVVNKRPAFLIAQIATLPFISHVYVSVRRLDFASYLDTLTPHDIPREAFDELLYLVSDATLTSNVERFTYVDDLYPHPRSQ